MNRFRFLVATTGTAIAAAVPTVGSTTPKRGLVHPNYRCQIVVRLADGEVLPVPAEGIMLETVGGRFRRIPEQGGARWMHGMLMT